MKPNTYWIVTSVISGSIGILLTARGLDPKTAIGIYFLGASLLFLNQYK